MQGNHHRFGKVSFTRRRLLGTTAVAFGGLAALGLTARLDAAVNEAAHVTLLAGEPGQNSALLQARVSSALATPGDFASRSPGREGSIRFLVADNAQFARAMITPWNAAIADNDFVVKAEVKGLAPAKSHFYRVEFRDPMGKIHKPETMGQFRTLPEEASSEPVSVAVFSCLSYQHFYGLGDRAANPYAQGGPLASEEVRRRGYPAMDHIRHARPDFMIATGDTVYYDHPMGDQRFWAKTLPEMRLMWNRQLAVPSVKDAFGEIATFFMKDDHDFRFDDADNTGTGLPAVSDGKRAFLEQVPVVAHGPTYRTVRVNRHLQIWMLEGRDYRSPNAMPDGPDKTIWGAEQRAWLEKTLLASDADFRIIISPTPVIGPDDARKRDNHASLGGFQNEGEHFLEFLKANAILAHTYIVNGDRHWKYHSIHPTGVHEFSCGTIHRQNSRPGVAPGNPRGTDPNALIKQPYMQAGPDGGFLKMNVVPPRGGKSAELTVQFWNEAGAIDHEVTLSSAH